MEFWNLSGISSFIIVRNSTQLNLGSPFRGSLSMVQKQHIKNISLKGFFQFDSDIVTCSKVSLYLHCNHSRWKVLPKFSIIQSYVNNLISTAVCSFSINRFHCPGTRTISHSTHIWEVNSHIFCCTLGDPWLRTREWAWSRWKMQSRFRAQ